MKLSIRLISILLAITCISVCFGMPLTVSASDTGTGGTDARYTQKIVSVLYDNSGSMLSDSKNEYALYALQMLMALLNDSDVLVITPMNKNAQTVTQTSAGIEVNLASSNREAEIKRVLTDSSSFLSKSPNGSTPGVSISVAVDQLEERGLKNRNNLTADTDDKEYWLVVLTDGRFNEQSSSKGADAIIESYISDFPSLRTIYLGLGSDAPDLSSSSLSQKVPFTPYLAATTDTIVKAMQSVANQLSGRYTLDPSNYTVSGSTVTVDLDKCELAFKNISVIAQNCGVTLKSAKHNGKEMSISNPCVIVPNGLTHKIQNGFSAVISGSPYLTGGKLVLEFTGSITADKLNILAEPALIIDSYLEYKDGNDWKRTTMQYINANLSGGNLIRVGYEVYEQANGGLVDLKKVFGECKSSVTYAGSTYDVGAEIPLVVGNNEIGVSVSVMNGAYTMYASTICIIEQNPTYYRVECSPETEMSVSTKQATSTYTVYYNNSPLSPAELSKYDWKVVAKAPNGNDADYTATVGADGKITVTVTAENGAYGDYTLDFTITSEYGLSRNENHTVTYYPKDIEIKGTHPENLTNGVTTTTGEYTVFIDGEQLTTEELGKYNWDITVTAPDGSEADYTKSLGSDGKLIAGLTVPTFGYGIYTVKVKVTISETMFKEYEHTIKKYPDNMAVITQAPDALSVSQHGMTENKNGFKFQLMFDGNPFDVSNNLTDYKVTVGETDVTQFATVDGSVITYVPHADHFGGALPIGDSTVTVTVTGGGGVLSASASAKLSVTATVYEIVSVDHDGKIADRFRLDEPTALYFKILRDGKPIPAEELKVALAAGEIKITDNKGTFGWQFWLPCGKDVTVELYEGEPVVAFKMTRDWIKPFHTFAAMLIFNGDNPITIEYAGLQHTDSISFKSSPVWSYIWRVLVILFVIHCILYIIGFFNKKCKSLPSGVFVTASIYDDSDECTFRIAKEVNLTFWQKYGWHLARFIPHKRKLWYDQKEVTVNRLIFGYDENGVLGTKFSNNGMYKVIFDSNGSQAAEKFADFRRALAQYDGRKARPRMRGENLIGAEVRSILKVPPSEGFIPGKTMTNYQYYGKLDEDGILSYVVFFVHKN